MEAYASTPEAVVAITLRNKALEAKIKEIGRRTGLGPSAVIARAIENEERITTASPYEEDVAARLARMRKLLEELPEPTDQERHAVQQAMEDMYGEDGLPR